MSEVSAEEQKALADSSSVTETTLTVKSSSKGEEMEKSESHRVGRKMHRVYIGVIVNRYGKRPLAYGNVQWFCQKPMQEVWPEIMKRIEGDFAQLNLLAPKENEKMAGDPGCVPRFGFEDEPVKVDGQDYMRITKILPNSAAKAAGLREGDLLVAIDSQAVHAFEELMPKSAYEKLEKVPVKYVRNGETLRTQIQAKIMCQ
jgi:C-terminal processing protease CtpA/Prc